MKYLKHYRNIVKNKPIAKGGMTIITETSNSSIKVGWARCNMVDNYCKKTGRLKAEKRFKETPLTITAEEVLALLKKEKPEFIPAIAATIVLNKTRS